MFGSEDRNPESIREFRKTGRHLPHWQAPGEMHFVTFSLLDRYACNLTTPPLAQMTVEAMRSRHGERYLLHEWVIMPDHVHLLIWPMASDEGFFSLSGITGSMKGFLAHQINRKIGRRGALWQDESFDHVVRGPAESVEIACYIWMNPVAAGLVEDPREWAWSGNEYRREVSAEIRGEDAY